MACNACGSHCILKLTYVTAIPWVAPALLFSMMAPQGDTEEHMAHKCGLTPIVVAVLILFSSTSVAFPDDSSRFDGPAELPRVYVNTDLKNTPSPLGAKQPPVNTFKALQAAVKNATCGEVIQVEAGATITGNLNLPVKPCNDNHWIIIRTSAADSELPKEGTRLTPCYAGVRSLPGRPAYPCPSPKNVMAKIAWRGSPVVSHGAVHHYRFIGIEFTHPVGTSAYSLLSFQANGPTDIPHHIIVDRCWVHGNATGNTQRGVLLNGSYEAVIDSTITDIHQVGADSQGINGWTGTGPFKIVNNFVEGGASSIGFGGAASTTVPYDIEIRKNYLFKPLSWNMTDPTYLGFKFNTKVSFESKNSSRVLFEGNILENAWGKLQGGDGGAVWLGPKNQNNACPICEVNDITFRYNIIRHAGAGIYVFDARSDTGGIAQPAKRYSIHDNLFDDINEVYADSGTGRGILFRLAGSTRFSPPRDILIQHNTGLAGNSSFGFLFLDTSPDAPIVNLAFKDNLISNGKNGVLGCKGHNGVSVLENCVQNLSFTGNVLMETTESTLSGNFSSPDASSVGFVDYHKGSRGDYRLCKGSDNPSQSCFAASPYVYRSSDGRDLGADINAVNRSTAGVD